MNVLINCNELFNPDFVMLEAEIGASGCWAYHKLRLFLKEQKTDRLYRAKLSGVAVVLRLTPTDLEAIVDHLPTSLVAKQGQYWQLHEITKELHTLNLRVNSLVNSRVNKGKGKGKDQGIIVPTELDPKPVLPIPPPTPPKPKPQKTEVAEDVFLADGELEKLKTTYPQLNIDKLIKELSNYAGSTGKKYKNHYKALCAWADKRLESPNGYQPTQSPTPTQNLTQKDFLRLPNWMKKEIHLEELGRRIDAEEDAKDNLKTIEVKNDNSQANVSLVKNLVFDIAKRRTN